MAADVHQDARRCRRFLGGCPVSIRAASTQLTSGDAPWSPEPGDLAETLRQAPAGYRSMDTTWTPHSRRWHAQLVRGPSVTGFSFDAVDADAYERLRPGYSAHAVAWRSRRSAGARGSRSTRRERRPLRGVRGRAQGDCIRG